MELDQLVQLMNQKPALEIQISGHTDDVGEVQYNIDLSLKRAKAVRDYLISKGIAANRITSQRLRRIKTVGSGNK